ncbi:MAG: hypothetical protein EBU90_24560 [Proteobacteria bacterium]|nr:hypothetical protein [Pseudomonadota bacterium]
MPIPITQLPLAVQTCQSDLTVVVQNGVTLRAPMSAVAGGISSNVLNATSVVQNTSSAWSSTYTTTNSNSARWVTNYTTVNSSSGNWQNTYTTVNSNSATTWNYQGTDIKALTAGWSSNYSTTNSASANWNTAYQSVSTVPYTLNVNTSGILPVKGVSNLICSTGGSYGNILGGSQNTIGSYVSNSTIVGGISSCIQAAGYSIIAGGSANFVGGASDNTVIGGGSNNTVSGYQSKHAVIVGGANNKLGAYACCSFIGGGNSNIIGITCAGHRESVITGGACNVIDNVQTCGGAFIGGGKNNTVCRADLGGIVGGYTNVLSGYHRYSFIGAGSGNAMCYTTDVVGGNSPFASIVGGSNNILYVTL